MLIRVFGWYNWCGARVRLSHGPPSLKVTATEPQSSRSPKMVRGGAITHPSLLHGATEPLSTHCFMGKFMERMCNIIICLFIFISTVLQCCDIIICWFSMVVDYPESWTNISKLQITGPLSSVCRLLIVSHYTISSLWEQTKRIKECAKEQQKTSKVDELLGRFFFFCFFSYWEMTYLG